MTKAQPPATLREAICEGLSDKWSKELEDALFWPLAGFVDKVYCNGYKKGRQDELEDLRRAGVLLTKDSDT